MNGFQRFDLPSFLIQSLQEQQIEKPMEIQERLIPAILNGRDVIGQSQTGSGKTFAFLLPIIAKVKPELECVQAVITAPTRELAGQIYNELKRLLEDQPTEHLIKAKQLTGGTDRIRTMEKLNQQPHIVVATPGRLKDMANTQAIDVHKTEMFVVDEADQMLDMGFIEEIDPVAALMPDDLQMLVFSATIPEQLQPFLRKYMQNPRHVHVKPKESTPAKIDHKFILLKYRDRTEMTVTLAERLRPYFAIVFTSTKEDADIVFDALLQAGLHADVLHGGLPPRQRKQVMRKINGLDIQYLVATDLAARGMDIKGVSHVINHSLPKELEYYVHRVGRTARAGETGEAYTYIDKDEYPAVQKLQNQGITAQFFEWKQQELQAVANPLQNNRPDLKKTPAFHKPKPKKVKPGYKKKARLQAEKQQKRQKKLKKRQR
ncbi:ATP-dependent RNA helicase CshB [Alteribacillus persepolensis]|uniref:ATP-dependent RNA helicase CshB n=1 Tax=Alteribacillus persepolensis TaxID=568899 RepID=A0A1G8CSU8_9BACI|nr:DEAD/DEAH box helicase [Alteribacillus persepolensis]SDH48546.1 ATP-dependent RNA helicase CshB [Alteribacillus persepolensis]